MTDESGRTERRPDSTDEAAVAARVNECLAVFSAASAVGDGEGAMRALNDLSQFLEEAWKLPLDLQIAHFQFMSGGSRHAAGGKASVESDAFDDLANALESLQAWREQQTTPPTDDGSAENPPAEPLPTDE